VEEGEEEKEEGTKKRTVSPLPKQSRYGMRGRSYQIGTVRV